jgi:hypothetical protein
MFVLAQSQHLPKTISSCCCLLIVIGTLGTTKFCWLSHEFEQTAILASSAGGFRT